MHMKVPLSGITVIMWGWRLDNQMIQIDSTHFNDLDTGLQLLGFHLQIELKGIVQ